MWENKQALDLCRKLDSIKLILIRNSKTDNNNNNKNTIDNQYYK
jgi:hypothetical protein